MSTQIAEFAIRGERDVAWAAQRARLLGALVEMPLKRRSALGKAVADAARYAIRKGAGATITYALEEAPPTPSIEVVVRSQLSPGDLSDQASTAVSESLRSAEQAIDELLVDLDGETQRLTMRQALPEGEPQADWDLANWGTILATRTTQGALAATQGRIYDLSTRLEETQRRGVDLEHELQQLKRLNETLELLALVASKTVNAVVIMDEAGQIEWVNGGFERMTGFSFDEIRGKSFAEFLASASGEGDVAADLANAFASGHGLSLELRHTRKDGPLYWASLSVTPVFDESGAPNRWIGIANDVTRRHEAQEQLRKARDLAEAASRAKSMFLANMSHEIRTPMNAILGMTGLTLDTELSPEQTDYLTTVQTAAESLLALLNNLLDLSKIEAGKMEVDARPFSLNSFLSTTLKPLALQAKLQALKLTWSAAHDTPEVLVGDSLRLSQVLVNLVGNALKFTSSGEVAVDVECQWKAEGEVGLRFTVSDTGIGISADKLQSIFEAFIQADSSTARNYGGTGLGLAICAHLVELMGGRIWVESEVGEGSRFYFTCRMGIGVPAPETKRLDSDGGAARNSTSLRVLVADDNASNRKLVERLLVKRGHVVVETKNGREALEFLANDHFDVALLDVQMPEMDGLQATARLRSMEKQSDDHLPIIAMTAYAMRGDRERCLSAGMDGYIAKPIRAAELHDLVESLGQGATPPGPQATAPLGPQADFAEALVRVENDVEILREQMALFLDESPTLAMCLRDAVDAGDSRALHVAAHRLRGFASCFDAHEVVYAAGVLEELGLSGSLHGARECCGELEEHLARLREALQHYLKQD